MTSPKTLLNAHNIRAKKSLGQNFLSDPNMARKLVSLANINPEATVLEIGCGLGALTIPLAKSVQHVWAIDKDQQLLNILSTQLLAHRIENVTLMARDVLALDFVSLAGKADQPLIIVGNLPYNISSQILIQLIKQRQVVERAVFMFQKELAERLKARAGTKRYGRLTVMLRYCALIESLAVVEAGLFFPRPRIDSEVLELEFHDRNQLNQQEEVFLFSIIKAAFGKRRKTLKNALGNSALPLSPAAAAGALMQAGIDPQRRAETLGVDEFIALSRILAHRINDARL